MGGTVVLGNVTVDVPPGAVSLKTRFFLGSGHGPDYAGIGPVQTFALHTKQLDTGGETDRFGIPVLLTVDTSGLDLSDLDPGTLRIARLGPDGSWNVLPTHASADTLSAETDQIGMFAVVARSAAARIDLTLTSDAPATGRHRVDPGATVTVTVRAVPQGQVATATLHATIPLDWTLTDGDGGAVDAATGELTWSLSSLDPGQEVAHPIVLQAPAIASDAASLETTGTFGAWITRRRAPETRADAVSVLVAPRVMIGHRVMGRVDKKSGNASYGRSDADLSAADRSETIRVRFRLENPDSVPVSVVPLLEYLDPAPVSTSGAGATSLFPGLPGFPTTAGMLGGLSPASDASWTRLPGAEDDRGAVRFYVATEARDYKVGQDGIDENGTRTDDGAGQQGGIGGAMFAAAGGKAHGPFARGVHSQGENPITAITIPQDGWTEVEFSVRATPFADWSAAYSFRLTDGGTTLEPSVEPVVTMSADPKPDHGPGRDRAQFYGLASQASGPATGAAASTVGAASMLRAAAGGYDPSTFRHGDVSMATDSCAGCHRTHTATGPYLGLGQLPQSAQCFVCHSGGALGSDTGVQQQFADAPVNDASTGSYFQHPATAANSGHTNALDTEFAGVLNRHAECADCHNPHSPTLQAPRTGGSMTAGGWTVTGGVGNASGVSVQNGLAPYTTPTYGWLSTPPNDETADAFPLPTGKITYEYQLCFKCHSGYTQLLARNPQHPSQWALDKGVELNPANLSFHPIEAQGKNQTDQLNVSLSETDTTDTFRLYTFTTNDTVRCTHCHTSPAQVAASPAPGGLLDTHASANRGILAAPYRDRVLQVSGQPYVATDFKLCYLCHATQPFDDTSQNQRTDSAFNLHGLHMAGLYTPSYSCPDTEIDHTVGVGTGCSLTSGAGSGVAICSECHFRTHSTAVKSPGQTGTDAGLVQFAPDVRPYFGTGQLNWTTNEVGLGSCTLICHGYTHNNVAYPD